MPRIAIVEKQQEKESQLIAIEHPSRTARGLGVVVICRSRHIEALARLAEDRLEFDFVAVGEVPMYNEDLWADIPASIKRMKRQIEQADGVLFVSPEYNRSFTAVLKNAIDWGTRPYGQNSFAGKPGAVVGTSPGAIGTAVGQSQLKSVLNAAHVIVMGQPEIYLTWKAELFDEDGGITH